MVYTIVPRGPLDLVSVPSVVLVDARGEDLIAKFQDIHATTRKRLLDANSRYKLPRILGVVVSSWKWAIIFG